MIAADADALVALVTAEDAAVFGVSALGGHLAALDPASPAVGRLETAYDAHRLRRDAFAADLVARRTAVPVAAAAYAVPVATTEVQVLLAAADLEARCAQAYRTALGGLVDPGLRASVVTCLVDAARQAYALGVLGGRTPDEASTALPGG